VPYLRTDAQIKEALANVEANKHQINNQKGKGGGKGKGKGPMVCFYCGNDGHRVADCPMKANGDPKGWGPPQQESNGKGPERARRPWPTPPGKGGPKGYGEAGSVDEPCRNFKKGKCVFGDDCIYQHVQ